MAKTKPKGILGIDPGAQGAFAILFPDNTVLHLDMPMRGSGKNKVVDGKVIVSWLRKHHSLIECAVIEKVHSMPRDGVSSAYKFGHRTGLVEGVLAAFSYEVIKVEPGAWKSALGLSRNKQQSLDMAIDLFPTAKDLFQFKKYDGRAEAALMAYLVRENF